MWDARRCVGTLALAAVMATAMAAWETSPVLTQDGDYSIHLPVIGKPAPAFWARAYGLPESPNTWTSFSAAQELADGGLILAGQHAFDSWLVRMEADGSIPWQKFLPGLGPTVYPSIYPIDLSPAIGEGVVLAGVLEAYDGEDEHWYKDVVVLEVDAGGEIVWQQRYDTNQAGDFVGIGATDDGYFMVANSRVATAEGDDAWLFKLGPSGEIVWQKSFQDETSRDKITAMGVTSDGGLLVAGQKGSAADSGFLNNVWVSKISRSGNVVWQHAYARSDGILWGCEPSGIEETADQGLIVAGSQDLGGCLIKLTANGGLVWAKYYKLPGFRGEFRSVRLTADGGYLIGGMAPRDSSGSEMDAWLLRLNGNGEVIVIGSYGGDDWEGGEVAIPSGDGYLIVGATGSVTGFDLSGLVLRVDGNGTISSCNLVHSWWLEPMDLPLAARDTRAQVVSTVVTVEDAGLEAVDSEATMVELCPQGSTSGHGSCQQAPYGN